MRAVVAGLVVAVAVAGAGAALQGGPPAIVDARTRRRARAAGRSRDRRPGPGTASAGPSALGLLGARARGLAARAGSRAERAGRRADRELPTMLDQVTRQLRSGASLPVAVETAARSRDGVGSVQLADDLAAGTPLHVAVGSWRSTSPTAARSLAAASLTLAAEAGGAVAVVLDGVTDTLRDRVALDREVAALSSQARASAAVLVVAPVAFAVLAAAADRRVGQTLFGSPLGWACLGAGALLDAVGALWMARLVGRSR